MVYKEAYNEVHYYMSDVTSRVVAKTGIPSDRYHLGKIILNSLQDDPEFLMQVDGATNQSETNGSALDRSVRCAIALKKLGLQTGDVMVLMGPNHIDLCIPHYAGLYLGVPVAAIDHTLGVNELEDIFKILQPKIIFSQSEKSEVIEKALKHTKIEAKIVTFNEGNRNFTLAELIKDIDQESVETFKPADFDPYEIPALLTSTSGTTGTPKAATLTHVNLSVAVPYIWTNFSKFPTPTRMALVVSPLQWLTAGFQLLFSPILKFTRLQTSVTITPDHYAYLINTYKPTSTIASPVFMTNMLSVKDKCDFTCFEYIQMGGSAVSQELVDEFKSLINSNKVEILYGMSEIAGLALQNHYDPPRGYTGSPMGALQYRMAEECFDNNSVHMFISELTSRIVAESGIPSDRFHLGKIILQSLKDDPDFVMQIDGATGESETYASVLKRTIRCATSMKNLGLKKDDVIVLMAPNHLDLAIPFYAGWYLGLPVAPIDRTLNTNELKGTFETLKPKIVFCQSEKAQDVQKAVKLSGLNTKVISFDKNSDTTCLSIMMEKHGDEIDVQEFKATDFDPDETISLLISTSGTTGLPKAAALTHKNMAIDTPYAWSFSTKFPSPTRSALMVAPLQWISTLSNYVMSPFLKYTRIQTSADITPQHIFELVSEYKPTFMATSPNLLSTLVKTAEQENFNFTNFELLYIGGSAVSVELLEQIKLVDVETKNDIKEPNKRGELWLKGPGVFKEYYNNPQSTQEAFTEDKWFMTGDLFYRDESWNFYFADRIKLLLKYRNHQISPVEVEKVIRQHPGVLDVAVTGVPDPECGDLAVACVVPRPGCKLTKQEIKDLVKENLTDTKQLRGGVLFFNELPLTPTTKLHRRKIKEIAMERINELDLIKV